MTKWRYLLARWMIRTATKVDGRAGVTAEINYPMDGGMWGWKFER